MLKVLKVEVQIYCQQVNVYLLMLIDNECMFLKINISIRYFLNFELFILSFYIVVLYIYIYWV